MAPSTDCLFRKQFGMLFLALPRSRLSSWGHQTFPSNAKTSSKAMAQQLGAEYCLTRQVRDRHQSASGSSPLDLGNDGFMYKPELSRPWHPLPAPSSSYAAHSGLVHVGVGRRCNRDILGVFAQHWPHRKYPHVESQTVPGTKAARLCLAARVAATNSARVRQQRTSNELARLRVDEKGQNCNKGTNIGWT